MWIPLLLGGAAIYAVSQSQKSPQPDANIGALEASIVDLENTILTLEDQLDVALTQTEVDAATIIGLNENIAQLEIDLQNALAAGTEVSQADLDYANQLLAEANELRAFAEEQAAYYQGLYDETLVELDEIADNAAILETDKLTAQQQADYYENLYNDTNIDLSNVQNQLLEAQTQRDDFEDMYQDATINVDNLTNQLAIVETQRDDFEDMYDDVNIDLSNLTNQLAIVETQRDDAIAADALTPFSQSDLDAADVVFAAQLADMTAQRDDAQDAANDAQGIADFNYSLYTNAQSQLNAANASLSSVTAQRDDAQAAAEAAQAESSSNYTLYLNAQAQLDAANFNLASVTAERDDISSSYDILEDDFDDLNSTYQNALSDVLYWQGQSNDFEAAFLQAETDRETAEAEVTNLNITISDLNATIDAYAESDAISDRP